MLLPALTFPCWLVAATARHRADVSSPRPRRCRDDAGQTTAEYALILIAAAAIAVLVISWATKTDAIGKLFDLVLSHVSGSAS